MDPSIAPAVASTTNVVGRTTRGPRPARSRGGIVAGAVTLALLAAFGTNVLLSTVLPPDLPLPLLQLLIAGGTVAVAVPVTSWVGRRLEPVRTLGDRGVRLDGVQKVDLVAGLGIGLAAGSLPLVVALGVGGFTPARWVDAGDLGMVTGIALLATAMLLVAGWEELLLRGVVVGELACALGDRLAPARAALLAVAGGAALFGLGHAGQPEQPALLGTWVVAGAVFGLVYVVDGRLALVVGAHAGFNIVHNVVIVRTGVEGTERLSALLRVDQASDVWWLHPGGVIELAGFILLGVFASMWLRLRRGSLRLGVHGRAA